MTYQELLEFLQSLDSTDSRLSDKVTIYDAAAIVNIYTLHLIMNEI